MVSHYTAIFITPQKREEKIKQIYVKVINILFNMALIVKDYTWKQSEQRVLIKVPLHGISASKVDLFTSPKYLKASYPPNLFEVLLSRPVDISKSECILTDTEIIYDLRKCEIEHWSDLEPNISKKEKHLLKQELVAEEHDRYQKECKEKRENKAALQKIAVREAIKLDTQQREHIAVIKEAEKSNALGDISDWHTTKAPTRKLKKNHKTVNYKSTNEKSWVPPAIRKTSCTEVSFTPRELPTPSRESRLEEENEWLRKQAEARRSVGFVSEDLRAEEKNPMYLKIKGDEFMNKKNYLGAISAYSFGISLSDKYVDLYVGRSEAQYHQGIMKFMYICV